MRVAKAGSAAGGIARNEEGSAMIGLERWEMEWWEVDGDGAGNGAGGTARK